MAKRKARKKEVTPEQFQQVLEQAGAAVADPVTPNIPVDAPELPVVSAPSAPAAADQRSQAMSLVLNMLNSAGPAAVGGEERAQRIASILENIRQSASATAKSGYGRELKSRLYLPIHEKGFNEEAAAAEALRAERAAKGRRRAAQRAVEPGTQRNALGAAAYRSARRTLGSDVRAVSRLNINAQFDALDKFSDLMDPTGTDKLPEVVRHQLENADPSARLALVRKFYDEYRNNPQYKAATEKAAQTLAEVKKNHPLYLRNEIEGQVVKGRRNLRMQDRARREKAQIRLQNGEVVPAKLIRTEADRILKSPKGKQMRLGMQRTAKWEKSPMYRMQQTAKMLPGAVSRAYGGPGGALMGVAALAGGTLLGEGIKAYRDVQETRRQRLEDLQMQANRDAMQMMQNQAIKASMQRDIDNNLARLQSEAPDIYMRVAAGRLLPQGAVVIGGVPRQDLLQQLGMSMANSEFGQ